MSGPRTGDDAPDFEAPTDGGGSLRLSSFRGRKVVLYFYPKDDTPGCTAQACSLRDSLDEIAAAGAAVLGVSVDDAESHRAFIAKHGLTFPLLVDEGAEVAARYGAWGEKVLYGRKTIGMTRATFIVGPDGALSKVWKRARAKEHGAAVLKALRPA